MAKTIPARSELDTQFTWATTDLYPTDEAWEAEMPRIQELVDTLKACQGTLGQSAQNLLRFLQLEDQFNLKAEPFACYAMYKKDQDTRDPKAQQMSGQMMNLLLQSEEATAFSTPEILEISDDTLDHFYQEEPGLEHYRLTLTRIRRQKEHTLSQSEEGLLASAGKLGQSPSDIYTFLHNADITFPDAVDQEGNRHPLTHGTFIPMMQGTDRVLRESAFKAYYGEFEHFQNTFASTLDAQMKQLQFFANARHYPSALAAALDKNEVAVDIYHNLIAAVRESFPSMHRYMRLRKQLLGVDELHYYDIYAPMVPDQQEVVPFEKAKEMAVEALAPLGEDYLSMLKEGFSNRWIDVYQSVGRRSGAYPPGVYS